MNEQNKKNYRVIFWNLFGVNIALNLLSTVFRDNIPFLNTLIADVLVLVASIILLILWIKYFNEAWKAIGKKYGWAVGLIGLIPFGPLICIVIAHHYLKGTDYWRGKYKSLKLQK